MLVCSPETGELGYQNVYAGLSYKERLTTSAVYYNAMRKQIRNDIDVQHINKNSLYDTET